MSFQIQPFSSGYSNALLQAGQVPNMAEAYAAGEKQKAARDRLLAQQRASELMAQGDEQGATNLLLSVADPGESLRYQIARQNAAAEQSRTAVLDQRYAAEQAQQDEQRRQARQQWEASYELQKEAADRAKADAALKQPITLDQFSGAAPLGAPPAGNPYQQSVGPRDPYYTPPPPQGSPAPIVSPQTGNLDTGVADVPLNPGQGPFGQGAPVTPAQGIAAAVQPPAAAPQPAAPPPAAAPPQGAPEQGAPAPERAMPPWLQKLDPDKQSRILSLFDAGTATREEVNKIIAESPRQQTGQTGAVITAGQLRDDFTRDTDKYGLVKKAWSSVRAMAQDPTGAKDMGMLYEVVHAFDPGTAVMEGDKATAQNTTGVPDWVLNAYNNAVDGTFLTPTQRKNFVAAVGQIYNTAEDSYKETEQGYKDYVKAYDVPEKQVIRDRIGKTSRFDPQTDPLYTSMPGGTQSEIAPGQSGASAIIQQYWPEFTRRLLERLNRGAGPQQ